LGVAQLSRRLLVREGVLAPDGGWTLRGFGELESKIMGRLWAGNEPARCHVCAG